MKILRRLQYLLHQRRLDRELAEEMEFHRSMSGDPRAMGNMTLAREDARQVWIAAWVESVFQDLRYAARSLRSQPGFTAMALLALILGIGLNTSLFTFYNAAALRPWPVRDPGRVVTLYAFSPREQRYGGFAAAEYRYLRDHSRTLAGAILERSENVTVDASSDVRAHFVSGNYFSVLGVDMASGRGFTSDEDRIEQPQAVAVLSHGAWQTRYGGAAGMVGRQIHVNDVPFTVVGVTGEGFIGTGQESYDLWLPLAALPVARANDQFARALLTDPHWCCARMAGRLAPGVSRDQAGAELSTLAGQFGKSLGDMPHSVAVAGTSMLNQPGGDKATRTAAVTGLLMAAVGSILLLACANVSNLLLARASARQREIAVRVSIGASRLRIVRQLLTESLLLAAIAGGLSLLLGSVLPAAIVQKEVPWLRLAPDLTVLGYAMGLAAVSAVVCGLGPGLRATAVSSVSPRFRVRSALLGFQVAISVTLLAGAALLTRSLYHAHSLNPGFQVSGISTVDVNLPVSSYTPATSRTFFDDLVAQVQAVAGPAAAGIAGYAPLSNSTNMTGFTMPGQSGRPSVPILVQWVSSGYFEALHIPILEGRNFIPDDRKQRNIIINETMARRYWPGKSAVGNTIMTGPERREVVGVVRDAQVYALGPVEPILFEPFTGGLHPVGYQHAALVVPDSIAPAAAEVVRRNEPRAVVTAAPLSIQLDRWLEPARMGAAISAALGLLALLLAATGIYGVIAYSVEQRRREIGVRVALGARPVEIVELILRKNARAVLFGLGAGLALALAGSKALQSYLYDLSLLDPLAYGSVIAILAFAALGAGYVPARRAARVDPVATLRHD